MAQISTDTMTEIDRKGVSFDRRAKQFTCRVGYSLDRDGKRVRCFQYLGDDPEQATAKHIELLKEWKWTKANWQEPVFDGITVKDFTRTGLPESIRDKAELDMPVFVKPEWRVQAMENLRTSAKTARTAMVDVLTAKVQKHANAMDEAKTFMQGFNGPTLPGEQDVMALLPAELRARVIAALQPSANDVLGLAADAQRVVLSKAKDMYLADMKARIGLPQDGIKPGTYANTERMLTLGLAIQSDGKPVLPGDRMLDTITREDLVSFKRAWLAKVAEKEITIRTAANYAKSVQFLLAWCYKRDRIVSRRINDLEDVFAFRDVNPVNVPNFSNVKDDLKAILKDAPERLKLYLLLGLNCGYYQGDIGNLKLSEVCEEGKDIFIKRKREKTSHQNDFVAVHYLWPETAALLQKHLAPKDAAQNPQGLALLNEDGKPLYRVTETAKTDNVQSSFWRTVQGVNETRSTKEQAPVAITFKSLRKLGATAVQHIGGQDVQKAYRAASIEGTDRFYVTADFSKLTAALKTWRKTLVAEGIL